LPILPANSSALANPFFLLNLPHFFTEEEDVRTSMAKSSEESMTINRWFLAVLACACLTASTVHAQQSPYTLYPAPSAIPANGTTAPVPPAPAGTSGGGLSDWIQYNSNAAAVKRDCCDGGDGKITPLFTELYLRAGPAIPIGGDTLTRELKPGWSIIVGGRALFYDEPMTAAWTIDAHIINTNESGGRDDTRFPLVAFPAGTKVEFGTGGIPGVLVSACNRTMGGVGLGREWYFFGSANAEGCKWRCGFDVGGRWGTERLDLSATQAPGHVTDVITSFYTGLHSDLEIPTHIGLFYVGMRVEWAFTWSDVLQVPSNMEDLNILFEVGLRF